MPRALGRAGRHRAPRVKVNPPADATGNAPLRAPCIGRGPCGACLMTNRDFNIECGRLAQPKFERVFAAVPKDRLDYRPHERYPGAAELLWTLAAEHAARRPRRKGRHHWATSPGPAMTRWCLSSMLLGEKIARLDDAGSTRRGQFAWGARSSASRPSVTSSGASGSRSCTTAAS
jgi:hypothetical protein